MRFSLQTKILVGYVAFTLVVAGAVYIYLNTSLREDVSGHTREQLLNDARLIQSYLENTPLPALSPGDNRSDRRPPGRAVRRPGDRGEGRRRRGR